MTSKHCSCCVQTFESHEEFKNAIFENERIAYDSTEEWQKNLKPGQFYISLFQDMIIYGKILEIIEEDGKPSNYRFVKAYSEMCQEGELGEMHVSTVTCSISECLFDFAMQSGFRLQIIQTIKKKASSISKEEK